MLAAIRAASHDTGPLPATRTVTVELTLRDPGEKRWAAAVDAMYRPGSLRFAKYATAREAARMGPSPAAVRRMSAALWRAGLRTSWQPGSTVLLASGRARDVEHEFGVTLHGYVSRSGRRYYAASASPRVPDSLRPEVTGVAPISDYAEERPAAIRYGGFEPMDFRKLYDMLPLTGKRHLDGQGLTVSFVEIDGYAPKDFKQYDTLMKLPAMDVKVMRGKTAQPDEETTMDVEAVHAIAPAAKLRVYLCGPNCNNAAFFPALEQAIRDTPNGVISLSIGKCEDLDVTADLNHVREDFRRAAGMGESVFDASGDNGAYDCLNEDWSSPPVGQYIGVEDSSGTDFVTSVGATRVSVAKDGSRYREEVWENPALTEGSGGGHSMQWPLPSWQRGVLLAHDNPKHMRQVPDVSAVGAPSTAMHIFYEGISSELGGSSLSAPVWAGMAALMDEYLHRQGLPSAGLLDPALYAIAADRTGPPAFYDVTVGTNLHYAAGPGYDMASGLGTPNLWTLTQKLAAYIRNGRR